MKFPRFVAAAAVALTLAGTAFAAPVEYIVGTGATYRPFEFQTPSKEIVGFDIDLMKEIAKAQGFKVKFVNTLWGVIFESVKNGDRDIIMSGITITPKRQESVDFSYPYFAAHQLILTQRDLKVSRLSELKGKNIAVCANSAGDIVSSKAFGKSSPNIKRFDNRRLRLLRPAESGQEVQHDPRSGVRGPVFRHRREEGQQEGFEGRERGPQEGHQVGRLRPGLRQVVRREHARAQASGPVSLAH